MLHSYKRRTSVDKSISYSVSYMLSALIASSQDNIPRSLTTYSRCVAQNRADQCTYEGSSQLNSDGPDETSPAVDMPKGIVVLKKYNPEKDKARISGATHWFQICYQVNNRSSPPQYHPIYVALPDSSLLSAHWAIILNQDYRHVVSMHSRKNIIV